MERIWTRHYDEEISFDLDFDEKTVVEHFDDAVSEWGDRPAVTLKGKTLTYAELNGHAG